MPRTPIPAYLPPGGFPGQDYFPFGVTISLLWEVTLAVPYGWWGFQDDAMIGVRITAWSRLPIEEVFVWIAVTYATVIVYEIVRRWQASGKRVRHALLG